MAFTDEELAAAFGLPQRVGTPAFMPEQEQAPAPIFSQAELGAFGLGAPVQEEPLTEPPPADVVSETAPPILAEPALVAPQHEAPAAPPLSTEQRGLAGSVDRLRQAYQAKQDANQATFEAEREKRHFQAEKAMAISELDQQEEAVRVEMDADARESAAMFRADIEKRMEEANRSTDSTRFWNSKGSLHRAAGFITAFLGAFQGPDMRQNVNAIIDQAVSRDIEDQKSEIAAARARVTDAATLRQLDVRAEELASGALTREFVVKKRGLIAELEQRAAGLDEGVAKAGLQQAAAAGLEGLAGNINALEKTAYDRKFQQSQADHSRRIQRGQLGLQRSRLNFQKSQAAAKEKAAAQAAEAAQAQARQFADVSMVQGIKTKNGEPFRLGEKEKTLRDDLRTESIKNQTVINHARKLRDLLTEKGREAWGLSREEAKQEVAGIAEIMVAANKGPASDSDVARIMAGVGFTPNSDGVIDPAEFFSADKVSTRIGKLENYIKIQKRNANTRLKAIDPDLSWEEYDPIDLDIDKRPDKSAADAQTDDFIARHNQSELGSRVGETKSLIQGAWDHVDASHGVKGTNSIDAAKGQILRLEAAKKSTDDEFERLLLDQGMVELEAYVEDQKPRRAMLKAQKEAELSAYSNEMNRRLGTTKKKKTKKELFIERYGRQLYLKEFGR